MKANGDRLRFVAPSRPIEAVTPDVAAPSQVCGVFFFFGARPSPPSTSKLSFPPEGRRWAQTQSPRLLIAHRMACNGPVASAWSFGFFAERILHTQSGHTRDTNLRQHVLSPQGGNSYGPRSITGLGEGALVRGRLPGSGTRPRPVTVPNRSPARKDRHIIFRQRYAKRPRTFRATAGVTRAPASRPSGPGRGWRTVTLKRIPPEMDAIKIFRPPRGPPDQPEPFLRCLFPGERHAGHLH